MHDGYLTRRLTTERQSPKGRTSMATTGDTSSFQRKRQTAKFAKSFFEISSD